MQVNWLAQGIGAIGLLFCLISFQIKSNRYLLILQTLANIMFGTQFIILGAYTGCLNVIIFCVRNVLIMGKEKYKWARWNGWLYIIIFLSCITTIVSWNGILSTFPAIACIGGSIAYWQDNAMSYRIANLLFVCPAWLIYDTCVGSYTAAINEAIVFVSVLVSILRFGWKSLSNNSFD